MRQYFSELAIGTMVEMSVVFNAASPRKTGGGKPYLVLELFDGRDKLTGNYWDWAGVVVPNCKDAVYKITGQVTEYNSQKQITVKTIKGDVETPITDFMPSNGMDMTSVYKDAWQLITDNITDDLLRNLGLEALEQYRSLWLTVPAATGVHHAFVGGALIHSLSVAKIALGIAKEVPEANKDLVVLGAMLHDIGKLKAYGIEGVSMVMTTPGKMFEHAILGVKMINSIAEHCLTPLCTQDFMKLDILEHIILSHHGTLEFGAVVEPQCIEAHIVSKADDIDAKVQMIREASAKTEEFWTDKIWGLNNRAMINYKHVTALVPITLNDDFLDYVGPDDATSVQ